MKLKPLKAGAFAGLWGAASLFVIQMVMQKTHIGEPPTGIAFASKILKLTHSNAEIMGLMLFVLAGTAWGIIYVVVVHRITPITGMIFSLVPTLVALMIMLPILGKPIFAGGDIKGILTPLILNAIWGAFVGKVAPALDAAQKKLQIQESNPKISPKSAKKRRK